MKNRKQDGGKLGSDATVLKIVFITASKIWTLGQSSGAASQWLPTEGYLSKGFDVVLLSGVDESLIHNYRNLKIIGFEFPLLQKLKIIKKLGFFIRLIWWFKFQIKVLSFYNKIKDCSLIITNGPLPVPIAYFLSRMLSVPLVKKFRGVLSTSNSRKNLMWLLRYWHELLALRLPSSLLIMTNDGTQGDKILDYLRFPPEKVRFWINGYSPTEFHTLKRKSNNINILSVCRLENGKGIHEILDAFALFIESSNILYTNLIIVGWGSQFETLKDVVHTLGIADRVLFPGSVKREDLCEYYNNADIFVSINKLANLVNPVFEAMRYKIPIITIDTGATSSLLTNNENCILIENDSNLVPNIAHAFKRLVDSEKLRKRLGESAYRTIVSEQWTWDERVAAEVSEIERLIAEN